MRWTVAVLLVVLAGARAIGAEYRADPGASRMVVHVLAAGIFRAFAHDHHFEVTEWQATLTIPGEDTSAARVEVVAAAGSLRDRQPALSEEELAKVNSQVVGPEVLEAERFPRIEFRSRSFDVAGADGPDHVRGTLHGILFAHGREIPVAVEIDATGSERSWRASGRAKLRQTDLGIEPFSGFAGTVRVDDEVIVEISAVFVPAIPGGGR